MITYPVIKIIETSLDTIVDADIVPETLAYPTSGSLFVRVCGENTDIRFADNSVRFVIAFTVTCSIRTRDFLTQYKYVPYETLLNLQEKCFLHLTSDSSILTELHTISERISVSGRIKSTNLNTRVQAVYPDFFGSTDLSSRREAGYMLSQTYTTPLITIPFECLMYPDIPPVEEPI